MLFIIYAKSQYNINITHKIFSVARFHPTNEFVGFLARISVKYIFFFHAFFILPHLSHCQKWSAKDVSLIPSVHMAMIPRAKPAPSQADSFPTYTWGVVLLQSLQNIGFFFIICAGRFVKASFLLPPFCKVSFYMQNAKKISRRTPVFLQECAFCITVIGTLWWVATQIAIAR